MSDHNRLRRRAVLLGGLGLAGASMASLVNLSQTPTPKSQGTSSETGRSPQPTSASTGSPLMAARLIVLNLSVEEHAQWQG